MYYLEQSSAPSGQFRLCSIWQGWFRLSLIFPSALLLLNSGNLVALVMAAVSVADALEDILQSGLAFPRTLEPFAYWQECYNGHLCHSGYSTILWPNASSEHNLPLSPTSTSMQGPRAPPLSLPAKPRFVLQLPLLTAEERPQKAASGMPTPFFCPILPMRKAQLLRGATNCKLPGRLGCQTNIFLFKTEYKYLAAHLI